MSAISDALQVWLDCHVRPTTEGNCDDHLRNHGFLLTASAFSAHAEFRQKQALSQ